MLYAMLERLDEEEGNRESKGLAQDRQIDLSVPIKRFRDRDQVVAG